MINTNLDKKNFDLIKDWKFWYKFIFGIFIFIAIFLNIINIFYQYPKIPMGDSISKDIGDAILNNFMYFTIESNLFVLIWLLYAAFNPNKEGKNKNILSPYISIFICIYITITGLVYNSLLLPKSQPTNIMGWISTLIEHMLTPILFIIYFIFFYNIYESEIVSYKKFSKEHLYKMYIYPIFWIIIVELRAFFRLHSGVPSKEKSAFLYFFLNFTNEKNSFGIENWIFLILIVFVLLILGTLLAYFYLFIFKKRQRKLRIKNE